MGTITDRPSTKAPRLGRCHAGTDRGRTGNGDAVRLASAPLRPHPGKRCPLSGPDRDAQRFESGVPLRLQGSQRRRPLAGRGAEDDRPDPRSVVEKQPGGLVSQLRLEGGCDASACGVDPVVLRPITSELELCG